MRCPRSNHRRFRIDAAPASSYLADMAIKPIIIVPDPKLRLVSAPVERVDAELLSFADDMLETMYDAPGIGLAAIQVAVPRRLVVIDLAKEDEPPAPQVFINPDIVWSSEERNVYEEGCLSIPDYYAEVERPAKVRVSYIGRDGKHAEIEADGLLATCLQHEIDHLNGVLFLDHISKLKRDMVIRKFEKAAKTGGELPQFKREKRERAAPHPVED
jgi:peptide deformylase